MLKKMCFLILFFTSFLFSVEESEPCLPLSTPQQIASLSYNSEFLIGGIVNPINGQVSISQNDMIAIGAQNLLLNRIYCPFYLPSCLNKNEREKKNIIFDQLYGKYRGWQLFPHMKVKSYGTVVRVPDTNGITIDFRINGRNQYSQLLGQNWGISNVVNDVPSGKYDPRNTKLNLSKDGTKYVITYPDGTIRIYKNYRIISDYFYVFLNKEILPNGKIIRYTYDKYFQKILKIESLDPNEKYVYASIKYQKDPSSTNYSYVSNTGKQSKYLYKEETITKKIKKKHSSLLRNYPIPKLEKVSSPFFESEIAEYDDKFLLSKRFSKEKDFSCTYDVYGGVDSHYKVNKLFLPVGQNEEFIPVYEFNYDPPIAGKKGGWTHLINADGSEVKYIFSKKMLIERVEFYDKKELIKNKIYKWTNNNWLSSLEFNDIKNNVTYKKSYEYDSYGNPIIEIFQGNLTGKDSSNKETFTIRREFSTCGKNLLLEEEKENGVTKKYTYLKETNLLTSKIIKADNKIYKRKFYLYDDCNNLISKIVDDGASECIDDLTHVNERKITSYILKKQQPFLHMIEWIEEKYLEKGEEKLLSKKKLIYDQHGNISQEDFYDAEDNFVCSIYKGYNERGDLLSETNEIGQKATYQYDKWGRKIFSQNFSGKKIVTNKFDRQGRLIEKNERGVDNLKRHFDYKYDENDRLITEKDYFERETSYSYDLISKKVIETKYPDIVSSEKALINVIEKSSYDPFGNLQTKTDARGNITTYKNNAYGSPIEVIYADGSKKQFSYYKNGKLRSYIDQNGLQVKYEYDVLGRNTLKEFYYSSNSEKVKIAEERFDYSNFHLIQKIDKEGYVTNYKYDGAGRKIYQKYEGKDERYFYDNLNRLSSIEKSNGENTLYIYYQRDLLNRITNEKKVDGKGNVLYEVSYTYDEDGNQSKVVRFINNKLSEAQFLYDSFNRLIKKIDPLGNETSYFYDEKYVNLLNQNVLKKTILKPNNISTVEIFDASDNLVSQNIVSSQGCTISSKEIFYDACGNITTYINHIFEDIDLKRKVLTKYEYDCRNNKISEIRAFGTDISKETKYDYTPLGQLKQKIKPGGISISYSYDAMGYLQKVASSDGKVDQSFKYNKLGYLVEGIDNIQNNYFERSIDPFGNIISEKFSNGLVINKKYDLFNRPLELKILNGGKILYHYDPLYLRKVTRCDLEGTELYSHRYNQYDQSGFLIEESMPNNLGIISTSRDLKGRPISITSPYLDQKCEYDSIDNIISMQIDDQETSFKYDDLSQLISEEGDTSRSNRYDSNYNRISDENGLYQVNDLDEIITSPLSRYDYDENGNLIEKYNIEKDESLLLKYDPLNRLIEAKTNTQRIVFVYDAIDRLFQRKEYDISNNLISDEYFLHDGDHEIGSYSPDLSLKQLKIIGLENTSVAIELNEGIYIPQVDIQKHVRLLINMRDKSVFEKYDFTVFGENTKPAAEYQNPWIYAQKRIDKTIDLIYFGHRFYDPSIRRWITTDPIGFENSLNLYQYVFNNPLRYIDLDGRFAFAIPLISVAIGSGIFSPVILPALSAAVVVTAISWAGYEGIKALNNWQENKQSQNIVMHNEAVEDKSKKKKKDDLKQVGDKNRRLKPDPKAEGSHSVIKRNPDTGKINKYATYKPQSNPRNPNPWEEVKRFDAIGNGEGHYNKSTGEYIKEPHVHDMTAEGGVRYPKMWEIPK